MSDSARDSGPEPRRDAPGTLYVVATPIGNLEDITLRALRVLRTVDVVAAEDTRRSGNLLRHYQIATPLVSLREHNERARGEALVARLRGGESVALVSDAGTPGISDPGALFVSAARAAGVRVEPVPGPSAVTAALSASGLRFERYVFAGFVPIKVNDRNSWVEWVRRLPDVPVVCFEAPHRIAHSLPLLRELLVNRPIMVVRELTKAHEEWIEVPVHVDENWSNNQNRLALEGRGEYVLILAPENMPTRDTPQPSDDEVARVFGEMTDFGRGLTRRDAIRAAGARLGMSPKAVFDTLERVKKTQS